MLTIAAVPKPFTGHVGLIQRNAISSWTRLRPACEVLLLGDEMGTAEAARDFGARHLPELARNERGTPRYDDFLARAQAAAGRDLIAHVHCDIVLMSDFMAAATAVAAWRRRFLMIGRRTELDVREPLDDSAPGWEERLRGRVAEAGEPGGPFGVDYFVFPRGLFKAVPPLALGRYFQDSWPIFTARASGHAVVDASAVVTAIHQVHDYSHEGRPVGLGYRSALALPEHRRNFVLLGGASRRFGTGEATHALSAAGIRSRDARPLWLAKAFVAGRDLNERLQGRSRLWRKAWRAVQRLRVSARPGA